MPGFERLLRSATSRITNGALRYGGRTLTAGVAETFGEELQNMLPKLAQEAAAVLDDEVPGVEWMNGKDGYFDGFWYRSAVSFGTMLPLAMAAGMPGGDREERARAFAAASDVELRALGIDASQIAAGDGSRGGACDREAGRGRAPDVHRVLPGSQDG